MSQVPVPAHTRRRARASAQRGRCGFGATCSPNLKDGFWNDQFRDAYNAAAQALGDRLNDTANVGPLWRVTLEAEPGNPCHHDAIKVMLAGHHVGYVPRMGPGQVRPEPGAFALLKGDMRGVSMAQPLEHTLRASTPAHNPALLVIAAGTNWATGTTDPPPDPAAAAAAAAAAVAPTIDLT